MSDILPHNGLFSFRKDGERHAWNPETISTLQLATRLGSYKKFKEFTSMVDGKESPLFLRDFFGHKRNPIDIEKVEPVENIVKHFVTGAMSFGAISKEAHEALALAMNKPVSYTHLAQARQVYHVAPSPVFQYPGTAAHYVRIDVYGVRCVEETALYRMLQRMSSWVLFSTGWGRRTILQWLSPVSYTHLDVYKRQQNIFPVFPMKPLPLRNQNKSSEIGRAHV